MTARVSIITPESIEERMAGPAIRAWNMADVLADHGHEVRLVSTVGASRTARSFDVRYASTEAMPRERDWADVVVTHPGVLRTHPVARYHEGCVIVDVYDPFHLENLEAGATPAEERTRTLSHLNSVVNESLVRGDFFLCASERQRDFWVGSLTALGRVNAATYDDDASLRRLIDVAPFGIPTRPPQHRRRVLRGVVPGIEPNDFVLLWAGGVYNWFDPLTLVEAVAAARRHVPNVRLFFLGMGHPNPAVPTMRVATELRERARSLDLTGTHVFFNEGWVPYDERENYLLEADAGVSTHLLHVETTFAFRTRVLDYLWAGLPVVLSDGDVFADLVREEGFGLVVDPGNVDDLAAAIVTLSQGERSPFRRRARKVAERFFWPAALAPLVAFCEAPRLAPDRGVIHQPEVAAATPDVAARSRRLRWFRR